MIMRLHNPDDKLVHMAVDDGGDAVVVYIDDEPVVVLKDDGTVEVDTSHELVEKVVSGSGKPLVERLVIGMKDGDGYLFAGQAVHGGQSGNVWVHPEKYQHHRELSRSSHAYMTSRVWEVVRNNLPHLAIGVVAILEGEEVYTNRAGADDPPHRYNWKFTDGVDLT